MVGTNAQGNFSLAAGRDLPRIGDSRAPSVGFDFLNLKRRRTFVLNDKIMDDFLNDQTELIL